MRSKWQRKYEAEAKRLVEVLEQWYVLEGEAMRLQWELDRCLRPDDEHAPTAPEARKPALLRRAEAGKPIVPDKKRGMEQSWKNRLKEVATFRENYEVYAGRLAIRVERLTQALADCDPAPDKAPAPSGDGRTATPPAVPEKPISMDAYDRMPPAMRRMRAQLEKVRLQQASARSSSLPESSLADPVETAPSHPEDKKRPPEVPSSTVSVEPEVKPRPDPVVSPVEEAAPDPTPPPQPKIHEPAREEQSREVPSTWQEKYQALEGKQQALLQVLKETEQQLAEAKAQVDALEEAQREEQAAVEEEAQQQAIQQQSLDALQALTKHFRHGQRSFLSQPDAPPVSPELSSLIYYTFTHLTLALASGDDVRAQAMYANLFTIARNLQSYKLTTIHGFDAALDVLRTLPGGDATHFASQLPLSPHTPGPEAQPIRACLKAMRDKASVELRPFFYEVDGAGEVLAIG